MFVSVIIDNEHDVQVIDSLTPVDQLIKHNYLQCVMTQIQILNTVYNWFQLRP